MLKVSDIRLWPEGLGRVVREDGYVSLSSRSRRNVFKM